MTRQFNVVVERDAEGFFVAMVPSLPGCHTQARSLDQLMERLPEASILQISDPCAYTPSPHCICVASAHRG